MQLQFSHPPATMLHPTHRHPPALSHAAHNCSAASLLACCCHTPRNCSAASLLLSHSPPIPANNPWPAPYTAAAQPHPCCAVNSLGGSTACY